MNMNDTLAPPTGQFQAKIYRQLDQRLKASSWNGGAAEAHGLLSALACRGVSGEQLGAKAYLLQMTEKADIDLLEGMYGLILRDLQSDDFAFTLLLPDECCDLARRIEALADWCGGFMQGFLHDGAGRQDGIPATVRESIDDIMEISRLDGDARADEQSERQLFELEEYLRVAARLIFEELNPAAPAAAKASE